MGFPSPNPENAREALRLLFVVVAIVVAGAVSIVALNLGL